jgi:hypothetical protein
MFFLMFNIGMCTLLAYHYEKMAGEGTRASLDRDTRILCLFHFCCHVVAAEHFSGPFSSAFQSFCKHGSSNTAHNHWCSG